MATANNRCMSDTDDEFHSHLPFPIQPDKIPNSMSKALVAVDIPFRSPTSNHHKPPQKAVYYNRSAREEPVTSVTKVNSNPGAVEEGNGGAAGGEKRPASPSKRVKRDVMVDRAAFGFRVLEVILSLIAFSVIVSDKTQGWSGDSFDRYKEYRYDSCYRSL